MFFMAFYEFIIFYLFFFFFQAEDGIRDLYVTGVQTCALPISSARSCSRSSASPWPTESATISQRTSSRSTCPRIGRTERSEERRVGKECRSRWARYH